MTPEELAAMPWAEAEAILAQKAGDLLEEVLFEFYAEIRPATVEGIEEAGRLFDRNWRYALLVDLFREGMLEASVAAVVVSSTWSIAEYPLRQLDADEWRALFDLAGFTVDGVPAERPSEPIQLWRGAPEEHSRGFSWTEDRELAQWFADRPQQMGQAVVWEVEAPPHLLLARITGGDVGRDGESEWVVDARTLTPHAAI